MLESITANDLKFKDLSAEEKQARGILGRLSGIIASYSEPTRNGRSYGTTLWEKAFEAPLVKEMFRNGGLPGEIQHPVDRSETDPEKIAIMMPEPPKKDGKGHLVATVDIVDTPCGRVAYQLAKYGFKFGISSRGEGDLITDYNGNSIVDPDTYSLSAFDLVIFPACQDARLDLITESLSKTRYNKTLKQKLTESINKEDENNQRIMRESLHDIGIDLDESLFEESVEYTPKFIDGMTIDELKAEEKSYYDDQYQYGKSLPMNRIWDIDYTIKELEKDLNESLDDKYLNKTFINRDFDGTVYTRVIGKDGDNYKLQIIDSPKTNNVIHEYSLSSDDMDLFDGKEFINESINLHELSEKVPGLTVDIWSSINGVMGAYQNANKWLDSAKEFIYSDLSCPFFSSFVHELAHTMPGRFDKFGDILHTANITIPYPTTLELDNELVSVDDVFNLIFGCLDDIKDNLNRFIELTDKEFHGMACSAEELLNDIESEYPMLFRLRDKWNQCSNDLVDFDKFVAQYIEHKEDLLESLNVLNEEMLSAATPYMLRNDGECISCSPMHPYIKSSIDSRDEKNIKELVEGTYNFSLNWFYHNTKQEEVRKYIKSFISSVISCEDYKYTEEDFSSIIDFDYSTDMVSSNKQEISSIFEMLNSLTNQEFCRVRTSHMIFGGTSGDIYFRISSVGFNWFNIIYKTVLANKDFVTSVTICKDGASLGGRNDFYSYKGEEFKYMPVNEFLTLSGNPLVEKIDTTNDLDSYAASALREGKNISEAYENMHPRNALAYFSGLRENYVANNFINQSIDIEESLNENFYAEHKEDLSNIDFDDLSIGDLIYVTNGMYDVCIGDVLKKYTSTDSKGRSLYGCDVNIIIPLDSSLKAGMQTNEWKYSKDAFKLFIGDLESLKKKYISTLEESTENISYKNTDIIENEDGTFVVTINDDIQIFNSLKNAKTYIDMMQPHLKEELYVSAGKMNDKLLDDAVLDFEKNIGDYGDALTFVKNRFSQYSLNDQKDIAKYINQQLSENLKLAEAQVGRDDSKSIEDVGSEDHTPEPIPEPEKKEEKETTIIIKEALNKTEESAADAALSELRNKEDVDSSVIRDVVSNSVYNADNSDEDPLSFEEADYFRVLDYVEDKFNKKDVNDNINNIEEAVENNEADIDKIYEMFNKNAKLEKKLTDLQEQLSASYARETRLKEEMARYKNQIKQLAESSKQVEILESKLERANSQISEIENGISANEHRFNESMETNNKVKTKLTESIRERDSRIKSLEEELESTKKQNIARLNENKTLKKEYDSLQESYADAQKDVAQIKEQYSKKLDQKNELIEKYQKIANRAVDKYIESQAIRLGVTSNEIKNKLPRGYGFKDIDTICESLQEYKLNMSTLPFNAHSLNESVGLRARNVRQELLPKNEENEITDLELELASKLIKK